MKLTEENTSIGDNLSQADGSRYYYVVLPDYPTELECEQLRQQILENQEAAEHLQSMTITFSEINLELEQENKRRKDLMLKMADEILRLKEKIKILTDSDGYDTDYFWNILKENKE